MNERDQKTEEASQHRREEARRSGNVPRSRDLSAAVGLLAASVALQWFGPALFSGARALFLEAISGLGSHSRSWSIDSAVDDLSRHALPLLLMAAPLGVVLAIGSVACGIAQGGFLVRWQALGPDVSRLSPAQGFGRIFRFRNGARGVFSLARVALVGWFGFRSALQLLEASPYRHETSVEFMRKSWAHLWTEASALSLKIAGALMALALLDYAAQRWLHARDLRMSRSEMLEEIAELEGNPDVRRRRRTLSKVILKTTLTKGVGA